MTGGCMGLRPDTATAAGVTTAGARTPRRHMLRGLDAQLASRQRHQHSSTVERPPTSTTAAGVMTALRRSVWKTDGGTGRQTRWAITSGRVTPHTEVAVFVAQAVREHAGVQARAYLVLVRVHDRVQRLPVPAMWQELEARRKLLDLMRADLGV